MSYSRLHTTDLAQQMYTPPDATRQIVPYIPVSAVVWEMCYGRGDMADELRNNGVYVVGETDRDCFGEPPEFDVIVSNPPYRNNKDFIARAIELGKPFALLVRLEHLGGG